MPTELAVSARGLRKRYGETEVLRGVDLELPRGSVLGLLGPNGAGKTTTVRILATLAAADSGQASVAGFDVARQRREVRRRISLTGQYAAVDELQTGRENLLTVCALRGCRRAPARARADELLERFELGSAADRLVRDYSGGMRRKLDLAASLIGDPDVVFLDEPTTGLDPRSRQAMWDVVREITARGVAVLLTTQYLEEADQLAGRIAVLDHGRIIAAGTAAELKARVAEQRVFVRFDDGRELSADTDGTAAGIRALLDELDPASTISHFEVRTASLDEVFLALTDKETIHV